MCFILDDGKEIYEHFLFETFKNNLNEVIVDEIQDKLHVEKAKKHCKIFYAMLNPMFLLNLINEKDNIHALLEDGAINLDFDFFVLQITIM